MTADPSAIQKFQQDFDERVELAVQMIPIIGGLRRKKNVVVSIFGRILDNVTETDIIKAHRYARRITDNELPLSQTLPIFKELETLDLGTASIDVGALATKFEEEGGDLHAFLEKELAPVIGNKAVAPSRDIVLSGFGRIGRLLARILLAHRSQGGGPRLAAIVVRKNGDQDLVKRASLLRRDSIHGSFDGTISIDEENNIIWANGNPIQVIYSNDPATVDYTAYGIKDAIVVDNTGRWRDVDGLSQHLASKGVSKVVLTAPGKGNMKNIVYGVNDDIIEDSDTLISAASCTTNGITPVLAAIDAKYGVKRGHVETVHSYTNDQNLIDNFHKGPRRGRGATLNLVLTETGAAKAVSKALPQFEGKLTGNAIRVPTPDVSIAVLTLDLETNVTKEEVNEYLRQVSLTSELRQQIDYIQSPEVVSTDFVGTTHPGIVDGLATIANGDDHLILYVWYDNEFGYSNQVVRIIEKLAGASPVVLPERKPLSEF